MTRRRILTFVGLAVWALGLSFTAQADTVTFTYTVTGNANAVQEGSALKYSFSQTTTPKIGRAHV